MHSLKPAVAVMAKVPGATAVKSRLHPSLTAEQATELYRCFLLDRLDAVLRQNSVRRQVIDLSALIRRRSRLNGHSPAPPASTPPDALRRPPSGRPGEPCFAPPTRRLQEDGEPAEVAQQRSAVLGRVVQGVDRLEASSRHRVTQHRPAVAAPPLPRVLGQTLRSPR